MASTLRQRKTLKDEQPETPQPEAVPKRPGCPVNLKKARGWKGWLRKAAVILTPAYIICVMFEVLEPPKPLFMHAWDDILLALNSGQRIYSPEELKALSAWKRPMLSILGEVFDVSKGDKHYGRKGAYRAFTGRDASRAFVTGDFSEEGLTDDVSRLEPSQCLGLKDWLEFYQKGEGKYQRRGVLKGRFYDDKGRATPALRAFERCALRGRKEKEQEEAEKKLFPNCNSKWSQAEGGRVWCADPKKVPRKIPAKPVHGSGIRSAGGPGGRAGPGAGGGHSRVGQGSSGGSHGVHGEGGLPGSGEAGKEGEEENRDAAKAKGRCACFELDYANANEARLLSYGGCALDSNSCVTKPPESPRRK